MRQRRLKRLWTRLKQLSTMQLTREELLMKLGAARDQSRIAWRLVTIEVAADSATFSYRLDRNRLRQTRSREGRYWSRTNLVEEDPAKLWSHYTLHVTVGHGVSLLRWRSGGVEHHHDTPPYPIMPSPISGHNSRVTRMGHVLAATPRTENPLLMELTGLDESVCVNLKFRFRAEGTVSVFGNNQTEETMTDPTRHPGSREEDAGD